MCDVNKCSNPGTTLLENGAIVCREHDSVNKRYVCKHCHVPMVSKTDHHPILGKSHKKNCPRRRLMG